MLPKKDLKSLKENVLFSDLTEEQYTFILSFGQMVHYKKEAILFQEGDDLDFVYILLSGELSVVLDSQEKPHKKHIIGTIAPGESIGEIAALTDKERSASVYVDQDSSLLRFSKVDFLHIITSIPQVLLRISKSLALRSQDLIKQLDKKTHILYTAIIVDYKNEVSKVFIEKFKKNIDQKTAIFSVPLHTDLKAQSFMELIHNLGKQHHNIICIFDVHYLELLDVFLQKTENIYIVQPDINLPFPDELRMSYENLLSNKKCSLIKIHLDNQREDASALYHPQFIHRYHHLFINNRKDYQSILRHINGNEIGLVLSGGAVKGWVHMGVLKALRKLDIPIDMIGGTSSGALAGACFALDNDLVNALERFTEIMSNLRNPLKWYNFTWPTIALFSSKRGTLAIQDIFSQNFEELLTPFYCLSANLSTYKEAVHNRGILWESLRASIALPGLMPPMVLDEQLHVDGGIINNLPVDVMRGFLGVSSKIIAVSLGGNNSKIRKCTFPPYITNFDLIKYRLSFNKNFTFPRLSNFMMSAFLMGAASKEIEARGLADIVIRPDVSKFNMVGITTKQEQELIELGYVQTMMMIEKYGLENLLSAGGLDSNGCH